MTLRLAKTLFGGIAILALCASGNAHAVNPNGSFIVASQVVSDTTAPVHVGDLASASISSGCSSCESGSCGDAYGSCGDCGTGSCGNGACGSCGDCGSCVGYSTCGKCNGLCGLGGERETGCQMPKYDRPDLFYNYYTQGNCNSVNAQMYISPIPVPHFVGHTFNTYQPFYPHHYMYWHKDRFHNNYDCGRGMNRTKASYYAPPVRTAAKNLYWNKLRLPR